MKRRGIILWVSALLVLALVGGGIFWWYDRDESSSVAQSYQTVRIERGTLERTVSSTGTLAAVETVDVGTEVSGTVEKVLADYNDRVKKEMVLAVLKPDLFNAAVNEAEGSVKQAEATLAQARNDLQRNRPLHEQGFLSDQEFSPYPTAVAKAEAALASARAVLARARTNLRNSVIRSPIDGTVIQRSIDAGQTVAASLNTPTLFVIARDLARMQIEAAVDETDIGQIKDGQQVRFSVQSYPDRNFSGIVRQIRLQPATVQNVVTYTVIVSADNNEGLLLPGMTATLDFIVEHEENVLLVPNAALRFHPAATANQQSTAKTQKSTKSNHGSRVFTLTTQGELHPVKVDVGSSDGQLTAIRDGGLKAGDRVVTGVAVEKNGGKKSFSLFGAMRGRPRR